MLSDVSVRRPVLATVLSALLVAFGALSFANLPLRELPDVDSPVVSVETQYRGASAAVVESRITQLIEDQISGIEGIRTISSQSRDGSSRITIEFDARWVYGRPRLIAQTWDHTVGRAFRIEVPNNLGTPGAANSTVMTNPAPAVSEIIHRPPVPGTSDPVLITARISPADGVAPTAVDLIHRLDNNNANGTWLTTPMSDDGLSGGDQVAGDGIYSATLTQYQSDHNIVQFYVRASGAGGVTTLQPKLGPDRPAMYIVDNSTLPTSLRTQRFIMSQYDRDAVDTRDHKPS